MDSEKRGIMRQLERKKETAKEKRIWHNGKEGLTYTAPFTMLSDNLDALHARSNAGMGDSEPLPLHAVLAAPPRSCSGDGDGGSGRADPLRGGGESTVICCGERSDGVGRGRGSVSGGSGNTNAGERTSAGVALGVSGLIILCGGTVAMGVSPSKWRKSASGAMCAMRSPIGVVGTVGAGISSVGRAGGIVVVIDGGGVDERPDGALRIRRRCLSDAVRE